MSAFVSHKFKLIFPHVPRTGGTSLYSVVEPQLGPLDVTDGTLEKHQSLRILRVGYKRKGVFESYTKFAVIRDPFVRLASLHQGFKPETDFERIVHMIVGDRFERGYAFFWPLKKWLCDSQGVLLADYVFRLEDGFKPIIEFLNGHGLGIKSVPHINKAKEQGDYYKRLKKSCSRTVLDMIESFYKWDFELFESFNK